MSVSDRNEIKRDFFDMTNQISSLSDEMQSLEHKLSMSYNALETAQNQLKERTISLT